MDQSFTDKDVVLAKKLVQLIGLGKFNLDIQQTVDLTQCLKFLQQLPSKIEANVFEVVEIQENKQDDVE
jgi:hypothetical protein